MNISDLLKFIKLTHEFQKVERRVHLAGREHKENDSEHSYQLAMVAWYLVESTGLSHLNKELCIKYALIHDFVEVYAGDTYFYATDQERNDKKDREKLAIEKLKKECNEFGAMIKLIEKYEEKKDSESRFVYALDKILPIINIYLDNGRSWKIDNIKLEMLISKKTEKISISDEIKPYFEELIKILKKEEDGLFNEK